MELIRAMCFQTYVIRRVDTEEEAGDVEDFIVGSGEGVLTNRNEAVGAASHPQGAGVNESPQRSEEDDSLFQGTHETLVLEEGENDSLITNRNCKKSSGHKEYIPVNEFNISHLPVGQHAPQIAEFIKATADLTVKVIVKKTSTDRPKIWPNTSESYPFHEQQFLEGTLTRVGTGMVCYTKKWKEGNFQNKRVGPCKCQRCSISDTPSKVWGEVMVYTATHVIFDDLEARHTSCQLFYDSKESKPITLGGWTMGKADINTDRCLLVCVTCDEDLLNKLVVMRKTWRDLFFAKYTEDQPVEFDNKMVFIVSHPHGSAKQVSLGLIDPKEFRKSGRNKFTYTAPTCPGSSGAYVHPMMYSPELYQYHHVHSGVNKSGWNFSGFGREAPIE